MSNAGQLSEEELAKMVEAKEAGMQPVYNQFQDQPQPVDLGKATSYTPTDNRVHIDDLPASQVGWKPTPLNVLPSGGIFYPEGTTLELKAATVREVRHFSTLDENDATSVEEKAKLILSNCVRLRFSNGEGSYKDLKEEDKFYLLFAIRELTFIKGEGKMFVDVKCGPACKGDGSWSEKVEITKDVFSYYKVDPRLMSKIDENTKSFIVSHPRVGDIQLYVPSIGVLDAVKQYMKKKVEKGEKVDQSFVQVASFLFPEWRGLTDQVIRNKEVEAAAWGMDRFSAVKALTEMIRFGVKTVIQRKCGDCGAEVAAPLTFPGGIRSLFFVSDIVDEIL